MNYRAVSRRTPDAVKQALLFVNKKKQKNFDFKGPPRFTTARSGAKVFWFFFSKKNILLPFQPLIAWLAPLLMAAASLGAVLVISLAPPAHGPVAALFPPWWTAQQTLLAASSQGEIIRFGAVPWIVVVMPEGPQAVADLHHGGAWAVLDPQIFGGCGAAVPGG